MNRFVVSMVRVCPLKAHDVVHVWNRGGKAGELVVTHGDGIRVARRLLAPLRDEAALGEAPEDDIEVTRGDGFDDYRLKETSHV